MWLCLLNHVSVCVWIVNLLSIIVELIVIGEFVSTIISSNKVSVEGWLSSRIANLHVVAIHRWQISITILRFHGRRMQGAANSGWLLPFLFLPPIPPEMLHLVQLDLILARLVVSLTGVYKDSFHQDS